MESHIVYRMCVKTIINFLKLEHCSVSKMVWMMILSLLVFEDRIIIRNQNYALVCSITFFFQNMYPYVNYVPNKLYMLQTIT